MAQSDRQGTERHPHKSTDEPYPHTKDNEGEGEHRSRSSHSSHDGGSERSSHSSQGGGSEDADLKEREYRDEQGNVHHHTRTYMEQHKGERDNQRDKK